MHLVYPLPPPPQIFHNVLDFSWDDCNTQEKLETTVIQNLGGKQGVVCLKNYRLKKHSATAIKR